MSQTILHKLVNDSHRLAKSSKPMYLAAIDRWIAFAGADTKTWTRYRMQEFYDHLLVEGLKPQSARRVVDSIRYASQRWAQMEARPELDFTDIEFAKNKPPKHRSALSQEQVTKLLNSCPDTPHGLRDFAFFVTSLETGMRVMSAAGMTIEKTHLEPIALQGSDTKLHWTWVPLKGIDGLQAIPLSATAIAALRAWILWLGSLGSQKVKTGPVFRAVHYSPIERRWAISPRALSTRTLYKATEERAEEAGIGHVHPHLFRHTFVTWRMAAKVPLEQISAITLHKLEETRAMGTIWDYTDKKGSIAADAVEHTPKWLAMLVERWIANWRGE